HLLRGRRALVEDYLRPDRGVRLHGEPPERAEWGVPAAATPPLPRATGQTGGGPATCHLHPGTPLDPHPAAERTGRVPLLRPMQPRLPCQRELQVHERAARSLT